MDSNDGDKIIGGVCAAIIFFAAALLIFNWKMHQNCIETVSNKTAIEIKLICG